MQPGYAIYIGWLESSSMLVVILCWLCYVACYADWLSWLGLLDCYADNSGKVVWLCSLDMLA
jgi:hypothetical protein